MILFLFPALFDSPVKSPEFHHKSTDKPEDEEDIFSALSLCVLQGVNQKLE
jgi:hypothetical protein